MESMDKKTHAGADEGMEVEKESVTCPYCGHKMNKEYRYHNGTIFKYGRWYICPECECESPYCDTDEEAYAEAMRRATPPARLLTAADFENNPEMDERGRLPSFVEYKKVEHKETKEPDITTASWEAVDKDGFLRWNNRIVRYWNRKPTAEQMCTTKWDTLWWENINDQRQNDRPPLDRNIAKKEDDVV